MRIKRGGEWTWGHYIDKKLSQSKSYFPKKFVAKLSCDKKKRGQNVQEG